MNDTRHKNVSNWNVFNLNILVHFLENQPTSIFIWDSFKNVRLLRNFFFIRTSLPPTNPSSDVTAATTPPSAADPSRLSLSESAEMVVDLVKKDGHSTSSMQALVSNRALARKRIIVEYVEKHRICTKYEITKEIRTYETQTGLKGSIDAKTTKRMLLALEKEEKLSLFEVSLKNQSYMCVRSRDVTESDPAFINYCSTFRRTFDSVDCKFKSELESSSSSANSSSRVLVPRSAAGSLTPVEDERTLKENDKLPPKSHATSATSPTTTTTTTTTANSNSDSNTLSKSSRHEETTSNVEESKDLDLTRSYIRSIVNKLKLSTRFSKMYALVPKLQKLIILHRFLHHVLYFNRDKSQDDVSKENSMGKRVPVFE